MTMETQKQVAQDVIAHIKKMLPKAESGSIKFRDDMGNHCYPKLVTVTIGGQTYEEVIQMSDVGCWGAVEAARFAVDRIARMRSDANIPIERAPNGNWTALSAATAGCLANAAAAAGIGHASATGLMQATLSTAALEEAASKVLQEAILPLPYDTSAINPSLFFKAELRDMAKVNNNREETDQIEAILKDALASGWHVCEVMPDYDDLNYDIEVGSAHAGVRFSVPYDKIARNDLIAVMNNRADFLLKDHLRGGNDHMKRMDAEEKLRIAVSANAACHVEIAALHTEIDNLHKAFNALNRRSDSVGIKEESPLAKAISAMGRGGSYLEDIRPTNMLKGGR